MGAAEWRRGGERTELRRGVIYVREPGEAFKPEEEPVAADLARLIGASEPERDEAARLFTARYGLLTAPTFKNASITAKVVRDSAAELRSVLSLFRALQLTEERRPRGLEELRDWAVAHLEDAGFPTARAVSRADTDTIAAAAQRWVARTITKRLASVTYTLEPGASVAEVQTADRLRGRRPRGFLHKRVALFRIGAHPKTLLGLVYDVVKNTIEEDTRIEVCANPECRTTFVVHDDRMRFCSKPCRARARYIEMKAALANPNLKRQEAEAMKALLGTERRGRRRGPRRWHRKVTNA